MPSIHRRLLLGTALLLAIVILVTGSAVYYSVYQRAENALEQRLQGLVYGLLGATDVPDGEAVVVVNEAELPDPQLSSPGGELYAELIGNLGQTYWQSVSRTHTIPPTPYTKIGEWTFERHAGESHGHVYQLQLTILWELMNGDQLPLIVHVVSDGAGLEKQLATFRRTLWSLLAIAAAALLLMQTFILRKALAPLNTIRDELQDIEAGKRETLNESVAYELSPLANSINTLVNSERNRQTEFRHLVDDLAHTLKTPLSVLTNVASQSNSTPEDRRVVGEQCQQMQASLQLYLDRAAGRTTQALVSPVSILPILNRLADSLPKIHQGVAINIDDSLQDTLKVRIAEGDLYEILGNLVDNACKFGATQVIIRGDEAARKVFIEDNGRGFEQDTMRQLTHRGVRADTQVTGQGLGLTSSYDRLKAYGGTLALERSDAGGARIVLDFP